MSSLVNESFRTLSRDGRWLCSPRNPIREAQDWLGRQKILSLDQQVILLGLGAGHHLVELVRIYPKLNLKVIELDPATLQSTQDWLKQIGTDLSHVQCLNADETKSILPTNHDLVLSFRPAWAGLENQYMKLYFQLTQNSAESLAEVAELNGFPLTSQSLKSSSVKLNFSLKDLDFLESEASTDEVKFWRTLRELID